MRLNSNQSHQYNKAQRPHFLHHHVCVSSDSLLPFPRIRFWGSHAEASPPGRTKTSETMTKSYSEEGQRNRHLPRNGGTSKRKPTLIRTLSSSSDLPIISRSSNILMLTPARRSLSSCTVCPSAALTCDWRATACTLRERERERGENNK